MYELRIGGVTAKLEVTGFRGSEEISAPYEFDVEVRSRSTTLTRHAGDRATLVWKAAGVGTVRHGIVGRVTVVGTRGADVTYRVTLVPGFSSLALRSNCRVFQEQDAAEIVGAILEEHGVTNYRTVLQGTPRTHQFVVQYRETDLDFVQRLLAEEGLFYFFEHGRDAEVLVVTDAAASYQPLPGRTASLAFSEDGTEREHVSSFTLSGRPATERVRMRDYDFESPGAALEVTSTVSRTGGSAELYDYPGGYAERNDGFARARIRLDAQRVPTLTAAAITNSPRLAPGRTFELSGHGYRTANRTYVAVRVVHEGAADPASIDDAYRNTVECIDATVPCRAVGEYPSLTMRGPQTATVVGPGGEEIHVDEHGRVKVQFHWDRHGQSDDNSSAWIRVAQALAGGGWGTLAIPRIGQEVLVEFVDGDPRRPVIVGALYNGDNHPPVELPDGKAITVLRTRSTPGGGSYQELKFDDSAGSEQIYLHAAKDLDIDVEDGISVKAGEGGISVEVGGSISGIVGSDVTESAAGDLNSTVDGDRTLETGGDYSHTAGKTIALDADREIRLTVGAASLVMKANGEVRVNGTPIG